MTISHQTIRPGLLVAVKTSVRGGVKYERLDLEVENDKAEKWETTKIHEDREEHERGMKARNKALYEIRKVCSVTSFGLLCPERFERELDSAIERASDIVATHNQSARFTKVAVFVLKGRIAETDEAAARAIAAEVRDLIDQMSDGVNKLDATAVRDAANKARSVAAVLSDSQAEKVGLAVKAARAAARAIVARVEKKGEEASTVLATIDTQAFAAARMSFLDMQPDEPQAETAEPAMPAVQVQRVTDIITPDLW